MFLVESLMMKVFPNLQDDAWAGGIQGFGHFAFARGASLNHMKACQSKQLLVNMAVFSSL